MLARTCSLLFAVLLCCLIPADAASQRWILAADIHLNPFNPSSFPPPPGIDSNEVLLDEAIAQMRKAEPNPTLVILAGDFLAHSFETRSKNAGALPDAAARQTMSGIAARFARAFPRAHFLIMVGNNDDPCGDYQVSAASPYLQALAHIWAPLVNRDGAAPDFETSFAHGAYYTASLPGMPLRAIVLNSVYWSFRYVNSCGAAAQTPGADEFTWLQNVLQHPLASKANFVALHIPPGPDAYSTAIVHGLGIVPFLDGKDDRDLRSLLADPSSNVAWVLAAHTHRTEFRLLGNVPLLIVPSISPVYRNDPAFFVADVGPNGVLQDYQAVAYSEREERWDHTYDLDATFGVTAFDAAAIRAIHARLNGGWRPPDDAAFAADRFAACAQTALDTDAFAGCAGIPNRKVAWLLFASGGSIIAAGVAGLFIARYRRRVV